MKNHINLFLVTLAAITFGSCENNETIPNDRISTEIFWRTATDATLAANGVYAKLEIARDFIHWDAMADIGHEMYSYVNEAVIQRGIYDAKNSLIYDKWKEAYTGIQAANIFMDNVDKVQTTNSQLIDRLKGEVKVLRAYFYIRLAILFGDVPLVTTETTIETAREISRTPVAQVWDFISKELTDASVDLPTTQAEKGRITKGTALALKARAMLFAGRYQEAAAAAKVVMELNVYSLYPSYEKLFSYDAENNQEVIFDRQFIKNIMSNNILTFICPNSLYPQANVASIVPVKTLVDAYQMNNGKEITDVTSGFNPYDPYTNRDPRLKYSIFVLGDVMSNGKIYDPRPNSGTADAIGYSVNSTLTGFNLKKYFNKEDLIQPSNGGINLILLRYPEVLLTYAEAKVEANEIDQSVLDAINLVRQRPDVNMPPITGITSQEELRKIVRHERLVELAFEGLRFFDIRRWRIAEDVMPGEIYGMTYTNENGELETAISQDALKIFDKDRDYLWPIPPRERELNHNLTQNPNW